MGRDKNADIELSNSDSKKEEISSLKNWWLSRNLISRVAAGVGIALCLYDLSFILGFLPRIGINIMVPTHRVLNLGAVLILTFLLYSSKGKRGENKLEWHDFLFLLMSAISCGYLVLFFKISQYHLIISEASTIEIILFIPLALSLLEGTRRVVGWPMAAIVGFFLIHAFFPDHFPGFLHARAFSPSRLVAFLYLSTDGIFTAPVGVASTVIIMFVILASFLLISGAGKFFLEFSLASMGRFRGGPAKVAVLSSGFLGSITGSTAANVAGSGSVTIPLMKSLGYSKNFAGAVEAVASNGGQIMPPVMGAVVFVMTEMTGIPYLTICLAALLPAILYFGALFIQVDLEALKLNMVGLAREEVPSLMKVMKRGWQYLLPIVSLVFFLAILRRTPEQSAVYSIAVTFLVSLIYRESRMGPVKILTALEDAGKAMCLVTLTCGAAGIIIGSLDATGIGYKLAYSIVELSGGNIYLLGGLAAFACFILGMGMSSIAIYLTVAILVAPALIKIGIPLIAAHLFVVYWGLTSFVTPPVCVAAFVASGISGGDPMKTGFIATRLGIATYLIPFMFITSPALLMMGTESQIFLSVITSTVGILVLAIGVVGRMYFEMGNLRLWQRLLLVASALLLIRQGWQTDLIGLCFILLALLWPFIKSRRMLSH